MDEVAPIEATCAAPGCHAPADRALTLRLLATLPLLGVAMTVFGFRRTHSALRRMSRHRVIRCSGRAATRDPKAVSRAHGRVHGRRSPEHIAAVVVHVNRHVLPYLSRCLLESTVLWYLLRRAGHDAELLLGARTLLGPLQAHAWVELDGRVLNDVEHVRDIYTAFALPTPGGETEPR